MTTLTKDSGIDWIGKIPANWEIKRIKDVSKIKKGKAAETFLEKSEEMLPCIDTNFLRGRDNIVYCNNGTKVSSDKVLILWDGANAGELFFNENIGYLGSTFGVFNTKINSKFWFYYLKGIEQYSRDNLTGMGVPHVDGNVLKQTIALIPSKKQQTKIANYLDQETSKIDRKISILEQKYEKLEEYKQSVIFETVTKGLDHNVEMKDSGIDWIGKIPTHWEVKRVKDVSKIKKGKAVETFLEKSEELLPCIDTNFLRGRDNVVFCKNGTKISSEKVLILWDGANAGELFFNKDTGYLGSTFGVFNTKVNNQFWFYYLKGIEQYSRDNLTGMGIPHVDGNVLKQTISLIPSKEEQNKIVDYLDNKTTKINKQKEILHKKIELLKEYKQTIIYEAVTGKFKVEN